MEKIRSKLVKTQEIVITLQEQMISKKDEQISPDCCSIICENERGERNQVVGNCLTAPVKKTGAGCRNFMIFGFQDQEAKGLEQPIKLFSIQ